MADNDGASGSTGDSGTGNASGTQGTGSANTDTGTQGTNQDDKGTSSTGGSGTFTQAQLDAIVRDRLARERDKYKGFDDLRRKAEDYDKLQAANQTDLEKAQGEAQKASDRAQAAEARAKTLAIRNAITSESIKQKVIDPDALFAFLKDNDSITVSDDGEVSGVTEAVTALLESKPYLKGTGFTGSGDGGQRTNGGLPTFTRTQIADPTFYRANEKEIAAAAREGRIADG